MHRRIYTLLLPAAVAAFMGCKSYEDSFNRNLNSTGLYVANSASNTISQFAADPVSGILNDLGTVAAGTTPVHIVVNSAGSFAYVVNSGSNDVYVYAINKSTRKLTLSSTANAGTTPKMIAFHNGGNFAYVVNQGSNNISVFSVNSGTGALTAASTTAGGTGPTAVVSTGNYLIISDPGGPQMIGYSVNTSTGALSGATNSAVASAPNHVAATQATNPLVYAACSGGTVDYIAVASFGGAATQVAAGTTPLSMTVNKTETKAFVSNSGAGTVSIYSMSNGTLSLAGTVTACTTPGQLTINAAGYAYLVCRGDNKVNAYSLGTDTLSLVGSYTTGTTPASVAGY